MTEETKPRKKPGPKPKDKTQLKRNEYHIKVNDTVAAFIEAHSPLGYQAFFDSLLQKKTMDTPLTLHGLSKRLSAGTVLKIGEWTLERVVDNEGIYRVRNGSQVYVEQELSSALVIIATLNGTIEA